MRRWPFSAFCKVLLMLCLSMDIITLEVNAEEIDLALIWSTCLGGTDMDTIFDAAIDTEGNIYVTGDAWSSDLPALNGYDLTYNGSVDAFVAKFSSNGEIMWLTYLGGDNDDEGRGIAVDSGDNIYVVGMTQSENFPAFGGYDNTNNGYSDAFVTKFASNGTVIWSTYLGGVGNDEGNAITIDQSDNIYISGLTYSWANFPVQSGYDTDWNGNGDAFVTKFGPDGQIVWSTFLGGATGFPDVGLALATDNDRNLVVVGSTGSPDFPTAGGQFTIHNGGLDSYYDDGFMTKFSENGSFLWSTYLGGQDWDACRDVKTDASGNIYITGSTSSPDFPVLNGYDMTLNGSEAFLAKFNANGTLIRASYIGGTSGDAGYGISLNEDGSVCITGATGSADFPISGGIDTTLNGSGDIFVALSTENGNILWSTFLGGGNLERGDFASPYVDNSIYVAGYTFSEDFPMRGLYSRSFAGGRDGFLVKLGPPVISGVDSTYWELYY